MVVVLISVVLGKILPKHMPEKVRLVKEISRKVVHIGAGLGWIILKIFFEGSRYSCYITATFIPIAVLSLIFDALHIQNGKRDYGLIYYTGIMFLLSLVSYFYPETFDAFGIAMMCLAVGDGSAAIFGRCFGRHKWGFSGNKSIEGTLGGFICASIAIVSIIIVFGMDLSLICGIVIAFVAMLLELFAGNLDNILIPIVTFGIGCLCM